MILCLHSCGHDLNAPRAAEQQLWPSTKDGPHGNHTHIFGSGGMDSDLQTRNLSRPGPRLVLWSLKVPPVLNFSAAPA